jgi:hypothetical protein
VLSIRLIQDTRDHLRQETSGHAQHSASRGLGIERIGFLKAIYPATWGILQIVLGLGPAMVYPSLAAVSDASHPSWRARSAFIDFGATSAMRLAHSQQVSSPIASAFHGRSHRSPH